MYHNLSDTSEDGVERQDNNNEINSNQLPQPILMKMNINFNKIISNLYISLNVYLKRMSKEILYRFNPITLLTVRVFNIFYQYISINMHFLCNLYIYQYKNSIFFFANKCKTTRRKKIVLKGILKLFTTLKVKKSSNCTLIFIGYRICVIIKPKSHAPAS